MNKIKFNGEQLKRLIQEKYSSYSTFSDAKNALRYDARIENRRSLDNWCHGVSAPTFSCLIRIMRALGCEDIEELVLEQD